jgi:hypothetical protein
VAAPAPETNQKWLERTREGGPCVLRHNLKSKLISNFSIKLLNSKSYEFVCDLVHAHVKTCM